MSFLRVTLSAVEVKEGIYFYMWIPHQAWNDESEPQRFC